MKKFFKVATWNINSIRIRMEQLTRWILEEEIDILFLQEIKCENIKFPLNDFDEIGYNCAIVGQKSYNGVAIITNLQIDEIVTFFHNVPTGGEARLVEATMQSPIGYLRVMSIYVPNGTEIYSDKFHRKLDFLSYLQEHITLHSYAQENILLGGDFNVALEDLDVFSPAIMDEQLCFSRVERDALDDFVKNVGLVDLFRYKNPVLEGFSWWDYRAGGFQKNQGLRIDYLFSSMTDKLVKCYVDKSQRLTKGSSDHAPIVAVFNTQHN